MAMLVELRYACDSGCRYVRHPLRCGSLLNHVGQLMRYQFLAGGAIWLIFVSPEENVIGDRKGVRVNIRA
jgi:hypothetical protein